MTRSRFAVGAALPAPLLLGHVASADLREECYRDAPSRLVPFCRSVPPDVE